MLLHHIAQMRYIQMLEETFEEAPLRTASWTTNVRSMSSGNQCLSAGTDTYYLVTWSVTGVGVASYSAVGTSKQAARDRAAHEALIGLGVNLESLFKVQRFTLRSS